MFEIQTRNRINTKWHRTILRLIVSIILVIVSKFQFSSGLFASILLVGLVLIHIDYRLIAVGAMGVLGTILVLSVLNMQARAEQLAVLLYFLLCIATVGSMYQGSSWQIRVDRMIDAYWQNFFIWLGNIVVESVFSFYQKIIVLRDITLGLLHIGSLRYVQKITSNSFVLSIMTICINIFVIHIQFNSILTSLLPNYKTIQYGSFTLEQLEYAFGGALLVIAYIMLYNLFTNKKL